MIEDGSKDDVTITLADGTVNTLQGGDGLAGGMSRTEVLEGFSRSAEFSEIIKSFGL